MLSQHAFCIGAAYLLREAIMQNILSNTSAAVSTDRAAARKFDGRTAIVAAAALVLFILAGFGPTYFFHPTAATEKYRLLVHIHAFSMVAWVVLFIAQITLIRTKNVRTHMRLGIFGTALAVFVIVLGTVLGITSAKIGTGGPPGIDPLSFLTVPLFTMWIFAILFAAAVYFRKKPAYHKRLMILTAVNFSGAAIARIPIESLQSLGPIWFLGAPLIFGLVLFIVDSLRNRSIDPAFAGGMILLAVGYPAMLFVGGTQSWLAFAGWLVSF